MQIFLTILAILLITILAFILTKIKIGAEFVTLETENRLKIKIYIFSGLKVFQITKRLKTEKKSFKDKVAFLINHFFKKKEDPIEYTEKKIKRSPDIPKLLKKIDFRKMYIEKFDLDVCLDLGNAAISAISTGAANAILGMVLSKYDDNILCNAKCNIYPGYTGDGVKIKAFIKLSVKVSDIIKMLLKKTKGGIKNGNRKSSNRRFNVISNE